MSDPYVREVGHIDTMDGALLPVLVDYDSVLVGPFRLDASMAEEFAQLFVSAVWQAGQQKAAMDAEAADRQVFACTDCTWHSVPGDYPEAGACPRCGECVVPCQCAELGVTDGLAGPSLRTDGSHETLTEDGDG